MVLVHVESTTVLKVVDPLVGYSGSVLRIVDSFTVLILITSTNTGNDAYAGYCSVPKLARMPV